MNKFGKGMAVVKWLKGYLNITSLFDSRYDVTLIGQQRTTNGGYHHINLLYCPNQTLIVEYIALLQVIRVLAN